MTIVEFLLARIADDETRLDLPEFYEDTESARSPGWGNRDYCPVCGAYQFSGTESATEAGWWDHAEETHGRTRVMAECKAKRAIIELHAAEDWGFGRDQCATCADWDMAQMGEGPPGINHPCPTIRAMAAVYADHADYNEEWKP